MVDFSDNSFSIKLLLNSAFWGLKCVIFRINTLNGTVDIVYLMPVGNILKESS